MPGKSSGQVIGYRYYLGMHMALCQKADALLGILVGGRLLYGLDTTPTGTPTSALRSNSGVGFTSGSSSTGYAGFTTVGVQASQDITINQNDLFGGDTREGGISGVLGVRFGEPTQAKDPYLQKFFGIYTPAFRGVVSVILKGMYIGVNPYLKDWQFLLRRISDADWLPEYAVIVAPDNHKDCNPAHMLRELLTSPDFDQNWPTSKIDSDSFSYAAYVLHSEGFGLAMIWDQQSPVSDFIQNILNHINGVLYVSQTTGKFVLKLLRADYVVEDLLVIDESVASLTSYQRASWGETVNEVTVQYTDRFTGKLEPITVQDLANAQVQGAIVATSKKYEGIPSADLATRVAMRDRQTLSTPLCKIKLQVNRVAADLHTGDVFRFSWAKLGIANMVMRIGSISKGTLRNSMITIEAVEDVFGLPATSYVTYTNPELPTPSMYPLPVPTGQQRLFEASFYEIMLRVGTTNALALDQYATYVVGAAARPDTMASAFIFRSSGVGSSGPFNPQVTGHFCPSCILPALGRAVASTVTYTGETDMDTVVVGDFGYIEDEMVSVESIDYDTSTITLNRGVLDTVPNPHASGRLFLTKNLKAISLWEYAAFETIYGVICPVFPLGVLDVGDATPMSVDTVGRHHLPYPPAGIKLDGVAYETHAAYDVDHVFTFAHRNRTQQTAYVVKQTEASIGPEAGVTYDIELSNSTLGVIKTATGLTATTWTYLASDFYASVAASPDPDVTHYHDTENTIKIWSVKGGVRSMQPLEMDYYI